MNGLETPAPIEKNEGKKDAKEQTFGREKVEKRDGHFADRGDDMYHLNEARGP